MLPRRTPEDGDIMCCHRLLFRTCGSSAELESFRAVQLPRRFLRHALYSTKAIGRLRTGHRNMRLFPDEGSLLVLDIVDGQIACIELLDRADIREMLLVLVPQLLGDDKHLQMVAGVRNAPKTQLPDSPLSV
jgi:hypothetical protein